MTTKCYDCRNCTRPDCIHRDAFRRLPREEGGLGLCPGHMAEDTAAELNSTARDLMNVRAMIEELQAEAEALTDKLKAAMVEQSTETLQGDGWKATWKNVSSSRFDSKAFRADHADLYTAYSKATVSTRFVLSV